MNINPIGPAGWGQETTNGTAQQPKRLTSLREGEKSTIYQNGVHVMGAFYEDITLEKKDGVYWYAYTGMTDPMNAGGFSGRVPMGCLIYASDRDDYTVDVTALIGFIKKKIK